MILVRVSQQAQTEQINEIHFKRHSQQTMSNFCLLTTDYCIGLAIFSLVSIKCVYMFGEWHLLFWDNNMLTYTQVTSDVHDAQVRKIAIKLKLQVRGEMATQN